jgi:hypothetical protein
MQMSAVAVAAAAVVQQSSSSSRQALRCWLCCWQGYWCGWQMHMTQLQGLKGPHHNSCTHGEQKMAPAALVH